MRIKGDWNDASEYCKRIENGSYQLTSLWSPTEKEALWSGYEYISEDGNEVRMPLPLLREVYLLAAIANSKLGNLPESMAYIDRLTKGFSKARSMIPRMEVWRHWPGRFCKAMAGSCILIIEY